MESRLKRGSEKAGTSLDIEYLGLATGGFCYLPYNLYNLDEYLKLTVRFLKGVT